MGSLFFTRYHFTIPYRPGTKNTKGDALSRLHAPDNLSENHEPILPSSLLRRSFHRPTPMSSQPKDLLNSYSAYFPGHWSSWDQSNTLTAIRLLLVDGNGQRHQKVHERMPGLRHGKDTPPLTIWEAPSSPIPQCLVSHLGVDFVTDLPASDGNTYILVTLDIFSKACHPVPLIGLPTAMGVF